MSETIVAAYADYLMSEPATDENLPLVAFDQITFETDGDEYHEIDFDLVDVDVDQDDARVVHVCYSDPSDACDDPEDFAECIDELNGIVGVRIPMDYDNESFTATKVLSFELVTCFEGTPDEFDRDSARFVTDVEAGEDDKTISYVTRTFPEKMLAEIEIDDAE